MKLKKPLPKGAVLGGIVAAGLLVLAVGWFAVVSPQKHKAASLAQQTQTVEQQITQNLSQIAASKAAAAAVPSAPKIRVADVYKLAKAMPSTPDMQDILIELDQVAKDAGVDLSTISPSQPDAQGRMLVSLNVSGDFYTLTDLLYRLRNLVFVRHGALEATGRLFTIDGVTLSPARGKTLQAGITLHTFVYVPSAAAPVASVPATTDTTATTTTDTTSSGGPSAAGAGAP